MYALLRKDTGTVSMWKSDWNTGKPIPCPIQDASCSVIQSFSYSLTPSFHVKFSSVKFGSCYKTVILFRFRNVWGLALSVQCEDSQELPSPNKGTLLGATVTTTSSLNKICFCSALNSKQSAVILHEANLSKSHLYLNILLPRFRAFKAKLVQIHMQ